MNNPAVLRAEEETQTNAESPDMHLIATTLVSQAAELDDLSYEQSRENLAKNAGVRVTVLDAERGKLRSNGTKAQGTPVLFNEPAPWHEAVNGAETLAAIAAVFPEYLHLPPGAADALALWTATAHAADSFMHSPRLNITAATRGCGKTLLLDVVHAMLPRPLRIENITPAAMFRIIAKDAPTLLIDECDRHLRENAELIGLLNAGFARGGVVPRCEGDKNEVKLFPVFAPVALCGIGELPGTLHDRSIIVLMERAIPGEIRRRFDSRHIETETVFKRRLIRWSQDHREQLANVDPTMPTAAANRVADVWRPLFAIAEVAGEGWPARVAASFAALALSDADSEPVSVQLLADVAQVMDKSSAAAMSSHDIVEGLVQLEERPWPTWNKGRPISPRQLARMLRSFRIAPGAHRTGQVVFKGYKRKALDDALARYVGAPPVLSVTQLQTMAGTASSESTIGYRNFVLPIEKPLQPNDGAGCDYVTDKTPPLSEVDL
ncbi:MAG: DUF3631 domain-containing protein [Gammaproteobacteria bacterium]